MGAGVLAKLLSRTTPQARNQRAAVRKSARVKAVTRLSGREGCVGVTSAQEGRGGIGRGAFDTRARRTRKPTLPRDWPRTQRILVSTSR